VPLHREPRKSGGKTRTRLSEDHTAEASKRMFVSRRVAPPTRLTVDMRLRAGGGHGGALTEAYFQEGVDNAMQWWKETRGAAFHSAGE
jgi:hypothetical protein